MATVTQNKKAEALEREVELVRSFMIGLAGKDPEGDYNPIFVKRTLKAAKEKPKYEFKDVKSFLTYIQK